METPYEVGSVVCFNKSMPQERIIYLSYLLIAAGYFYKPRMRNGEIQLVITGYYSN